MSRDYSNYSTDEIEKEFEKGLERTISKDEIKTSDLIKSGILIFLTGTLTGIGVSEGIERYRGKRKIKKEDN